jgi:hypothetical protein
MTFDVVVLGGGPAGVGAAVAAARLGARTLLVERHVALGGMGTSALVNNFCPAHLDGSRLIIGGIFAELRERLVRRRAIYLSPGNGYAMEPFAPDAMEAECAALCVDAGVTVWTGAGLGEAQFSAADRVMLRLDDGRCVETRVAVDASGDAVLAPAAGTPFRTGGAGRMMPLTWCYVVGPVNVDALRAAWPWAVRDDITTGEPAVCLAGCAGDLVASARAAGELDIPVSCIAAALNIPGRPDQVSMNFGRVFVDDATDPGQLATARERGRYQMQEGVQFLRRRIPGFEQVTVLEEPRQIGVRETRRIVGRYTLVESDVLACRQFDDVVAQCCYAIDVHDASSASTRLVELPRGSHYDIPWRCLVPREGAPNVIYAGRSISADQAAMSSFRVSPSVLAIGEAAGVTAALASAADGMVSFVDPAQVQRRLRETGGVLE